MQLLTIVSPEEFLERLATVTSIRRPWFRSLAGQYQFVGQIKADSFSLTPVIRGRNTYLPKVTGIVRRVGVRTEIDVTQSLHPTAIVVLSIFFVVFISASFRAADWKSVVALLALPLIFHSVMYVIGFLPEAARVEQRLSGMAVPLL